MKARVCQPWDVAALEEFLRRDKVANVAMLERLAANPPGANAIWLSAGHHASIEAAIYQSGIVVVAGGGDDAVAAIANSVKPWRPVVSVVGPSESTLRLYQLVAKRFGSAWNAPRNIRSRQHHMIADVSPEAAPDPRVQVLGPPSFESYLAASVHMYTHEIGENPMLHDNGYAEVVKRRLHRQRAFGVVSNGRVVFKADIGISFEDVAQIHGVWMHPSFRGRGLAAGAMAGVVAMIRQRFPIVSLYVNSFNTAAIRTYERSGFRTIGDFATVHY